MVPRLKSRFLCLQIHTFLQHSHDSRELQPFLGPGLLQLKKHLLLQCSWAPPITAPPQEDQESGLVPGAASEKTPSLTLMFTQHYLISADCTSDNSPLQLTQPSEPCYLIPPHWADKERGLRKVKSLDQDHSAKTKSN